MKLFKNRGDIYISKSGVNATKQAKILYTLLAIVVIFTVVFIVLLSQRYSSAAEFFAQGEITSTSEGSTHFNDTLPQISGKTNFLILETDDEETQIHYIFLLQGDKDNLAYKACALPCNMKLDDKSLMDIYSQGGGAALQKSLTEYFGFEIDYQITFKTSAFVEFVNKLGTVVYNSNSEIRFSGGEDDDKYSLNINQGEQKINAREITNLLRFFSQEEQNYTAENELVLKTVTELLNAENYEKSESLFRLFIKSSTTDITVRDYESGKNSLMVYCTKNTDITVYSALCEAEDNVITQESVKAIKGYFSK